MSITVIIPTYNRGHLIKRSIESVLNQTNPPSEILVVDDHSTDNTYEIIESIQDNRVKYIKNYRRKGANGARNSGILKTKTKYVAFQDSDDIWHPQKLEKQIKIISKSIGYDMCFSSFNLIQKDGVKLFPEYKIISEEILSKLRTGNFISTQTIILKTKIAKELLFDESLLRLQDWDFVLRIAKTYRIFHLDEPLVDVEVQNDSITKNIHILEAYEDIFKKHPYLSTVTHYNRYLYFRITGKNEWSNRNYIASIINYGKAFFNRIKHSKREFNIGRFYNKPSQS